jgi:NAD(P)-dependent dehydrogenase (short-subunit alcohol dehydrogenase family)
MNVLVTGGSRGLGKALIERFQQEGHTTFNASPSTGFDVRLNSDMMNLSMSLSPNVIICNAGVYGPIEPFGHSAFSDAWKDCIEVNLMGTVNTCHAFLPWMQARGKGKIIIIAGGGATKPMPNFSAYAASKAAVVRFAETLALEVKDYGIDVNCISPGLLNTDIHKHVIAAGVEKAGRLAYDEAMALRDATPAFSKPCDLAVWLASDKSNGITGRLISAVWDDWESFTPDMPADKYTLRRVT